MTPDGGTATGSTTCAVGCWRHISSTLTLGTRLWGSSQDQACPIFTTILAVHRDCPWGWGPVLVLPEACGDERLVARLLCWRRPG